MTDIVERLRAHDPSRWRAADTDTGTLVREAADEIERLTRELNQPIPWALERDLRAEIERLREALDRLTTQRRQDIGQLRAENERLQAALSKAIDELSYTDLRASGGIAEAP